MPTRNQHRPIRLLHLSDIHFTAGKAWDADPVLRALARFIAQEVKGGLIPDLVVITGDLAFAGTADEYRLARDWLDNQLWPALPDGFPRDRLLLVPGNHDVDRRQVGSGARHIQDGLLVKQTQDGIATLLKDDDERKIVLKRHAGYLEFLGGWLGEPQLLPWWQRRIDIRGTRLHVAGFDSAWMACGEADRGRLLLGRYQVNQTVLSQDADDADWRLALLHHPWDYFAEFDGHETRSTIHQHCDLLLRGHLHQPQSERVVPPDPSRACLELAAGCVYEHGRFPNAFQWIELHPRPRRVKVRFRAWIQSAWTIDRNQPGCPNGEAEFALRSAPIPDDDLREESSPAGTAGHTAEDLHEAAVNAITESLERAPALHAALVKRLVATGAITAADLAARLCAPQDDFSIAIAAFEAALPEAARQLRQSQRDVGSLRQDALDVLGWMVVTTVVDGYDREDARLAQTWFDGIAFRIPLWRNPCLEVLMACWRHGKAEFITEPAHFDYGKNDITPKGFGEIGFDDPKRLDFGRAVGFVWRRVYQEIHGDTAQSELPPAKIEVLRAWLNRQLKEKKRRWRLVIDQNDMDVAVDFNTTLQAIHGEIPQIHLIVIDSRVTADPGIFVLPANDLAAGIYDCLHAIKDLP